MTASIIPQTKTCTHCKLEKPVTEFYKRPLKDDQYNAWCKACMKTGNQGRPKLPKNITADPAEQAVLNSLRSMQIWAVPGRDYRTHAHVDLVCWGCVSIEVKSARPDHLGHCGFSFSETQQANGISGDVVVLVRILPTEYMFHVFPSTHAIFYRSGMVKSIVYFNPNPTRRIGYNRNRRHINITPLTPELMQKHENAWHLIEEVRIQKGREIATS